MTDGPVAPFRPTPLPSVGGGARRVIAWDELDFGGIDEPARRVIGASWRDRMRQEHLAIGAFALLASELAAEGASPTVLSIVARASADEVRHSQICREFAQRLLGEGTVPARLKGVPSAPTHPGATASQRVLFHVVEMCCLSETLTAVYFAELLARTTNATARAVLESLLEDEVDHGRVGWAYVAERAQESRSDTDGLAGLSAALPAIFDRMLRRMLDRPAAPPDDPRLEAYGHLGPHEGARIYREALREVLLPGFDGLGVDLAPTMALLHRRGWA